MAINLQKKGGVFICKIFDTFSENTQKMLYILQLSYETIYFYKPCISRLSNSEKYIICCNFKGYNTEIVNKMIHHFTEEINIDLDLDIDFKNILYKYNCLYTSIQIDQINEGINLIQKNNIRKYPSKDQIKKAKEWCQKYNVPINYNCFYLKSTIS